MEDVKVEGIQICSRVKWIKSSGWTIGSNYCLKEFFKAIEKMSKSATITISRNSNKGTIETTKELEETCCTYY